MTAAIQKPAVLVVNDSDLGREAIVKTLQAHFSVTEASTGAEGIAKSLAGPDIILLDVILPDISGLDVCRRIKQAPATCHIPVLHLSASSPDARSRAVGLENGADGFLPLPVEGEVLVATVNSLLRIKKAEAELAAGNQRLAAISEIDRIFLSTRGKETWEALLAAALKWIPGDAGVLVYFDGTGKPVLGAAAGERTGKGPGTGTGAAPAAAPGREKLPGAGSIVGGRVVVNNGPSSLELPDGRIEVRRSINIPLMDRGLVSGYLTLGGGTRDYTSGEAAFAGLIGGHISTLLQGRLEAEKQEERNRQMLLEMADMQKIESLGQLAGGIAHDFNNILTGIQGNLSVLDRSKSLDEEARGTIADLVSAAREAGKITLQLLTFSKGGKLVKKVFRLEEHLSSWCSFAMRGSNCKVELDVAAGLWPLCGDVGRIGQVVGNLLCNARQAMPGGGRVKVAAENTRQVPPADPPLRAGSYVKLTVADNGCGIDPGDLQKIFEPYFTTKPQGHGLGLSTAYSIIKNHGGHIKIVSHRGAGTEVAVYLPAAAGPVPLTAAARSGERSGTGRVLVMDDEEIVRTAVRRMLGSLGYGCVCAADGEEALALYKEALEKREAFKAVILDLTVPGGMGGAEAVKKLFGLDPGAKVVLSSGYADDILPACSTSGGLCVSLGKPYRYEDLAEALAKIMAAY